MAVAGIAKGARRPVVPLVAADSAAEILRYRCIAPYAVSVPNLCLVPSHQSFIFPATIRCISTVFLCSTIRCVSPGLHHTVHQYHLARREVAIGTWLYRSLVVTENSPVGGSGSRPSGTSHSSNQTRETAIWYKLQERMVVFKVFVESVLQAVSGA